MVRVRSIQEQVHSKLVLERSKFELVHNMMVLAHSTSHSKKTFV